MIDDGSTDGSAAVAEAEVRRDRRIRLVKNERNLGIAHTRNKGLALARGELVAFLDCDDVSSPNRLGCQVAFMDAHPEVGVCGGFMQQITLDGELLMNEIARCPLDHDSIARYLAIDCTLFNPTLIVRKSIIEAHALHHNPAYQAASDMDWYIRLAKVVRLANLPKVLTFYRRHPRQITSRHRFIARRNTINLHLGLMLLEIQRLQPQVRAELTPVSAEMTEVDFFRNMVRIEQAIAGLTGLGTGAAGEQQVYNVLKKHLNLMWWDIASCLPRYSLPVWQVVKQSAFIKSLPVLIRWKVWFKCMASVVQVARGTL